MENAKGEKIVYSRDELIRTIERVTSQFSRLKRRESREAVIGRLKELFRITKRTQPDLYAELILKGWVKDRDMSTEVVAPSLSIRKSDAPILNGTDITEETGYIKSSDIPF